MTWFRRQNYDAYPNSTYGIAERELEEYRLLQTRARVLARVKLFGDALTPEQTDVIMRAREAKVPVHFELIRMLPGRRHKKMYGTFRHQLVGAGAWSFVGRMCPCGKVKLS